MFKLLQSMNRNVKTFPWRVLATTTVVALAAGVAQTVLAAPGGPGMHEGRDGMRMHRHMDAGGGMGGMAMSPHHLERVLDSVNATAEQRAQISKIVEAARVDMAAQKAARRSLHDQSQAVFAQPNVDARAAEALRQQMLAQHDQASKRMLQVKLDISRVLTPEQRKTLTERMERRRGMMERHQLERQSLDKPKA